jgi:uncharacterized membrane protein
MSTHTQDISPIGVRAHAARTSGRDDLVLGGAVVTMGLLAGLFYSYSCSVMPGLHASADRTVVDAMQNINKAIENPVFFATFMGGPALALLAYVGERRRGTPVVARWVLAGVVLGGVTLLVTAAFDIPLNNELERAGDPSTIADIAQVRDDFETPWVVWNLVRTVTVTAAFGCLARALYLRARVSGRGAPRASAARRG